MTDPRLARQLLLEEFRSGGQARVSAATLELRSEAPADVVDAARRYARRAGISREIFTEGVPPFPHEHAFRHASSRALAEGAHLALRTTLKALDS